MAFDPVQLGLKKVSASPSPGSAPSVAKTGFDPSSLGLRKVSGAAPASAQVPANRFLPNYTTSGTDISAANVAKARDVSNIPIFGSDLSTAMKKGEAILDKPKTGLLPEMGAGFELAGAVAAPIANAPVRLAEAADQALTGGVVKGALKTAVSDVAGTKVGKAVVGAVDSFGKAHPTLAKGFGNAMNIIGAIPAAGALEKVGAEGAELAGKAAGAVGGAVDAAKVSATKGTRIPTLATAASRVQETERETTGLEKAMRQGVGDTTINSPSALHAQYYAQEQKALSDTKQDTALGLVGSDIGDAFGKVVAQRKAAGKIMGDELEKSSGKAVLIGPAFGNFQKELVDNGATYDSITGELIGGSTSKFSTTDKNILSKYAADLQTLGKSPTMKELDAFISRTPNEIKELKASKGIVSKTNAERLISSNLNDLRDSLGSVGSKAYNAARSSYSTLSKFIQEGEPYLGKVTQSGDYSKDASLAKSSVQSVLNNGKKDWLLELEKLTGQPLLDKATLALQAMKDAGDYRGASLLESLTEGAAKGKVPEIPTSLTGMVNQGLGKAVGKAAKKFVGTPYEQTQRFLKSLEKK